MSDAARAGCYLCEDGVGVYRAVVESPPGVHHAVNTIVCEECRDADRVLDADSVPVSVVRFETELDELHDRNLIDSAGSPCTYCGRDSGGETRPVCVAGREFVPALCGDCYQALRDVGRIDEGRELEVFHA